MQQMLVESDPPRLIEQSGKITLKTAEQRESVWEALDKLAGTGEIFTSRELWLTPGVWGHFQQTYIVLKKARELGWVEKVSFGHYRCIVV